jgi:geranyl-CoA carboxylase alpha subunit
VPADVIVLRDAAGREHRVQRGADGLATIGDVKLTIRAAPDGTLHVLGSANHVAWATTVGGTRWVYVEGEVFTFEADRAPSTRPRATGHHGSLMAPMPATVRKVLVKPGDTVRKSEVLIVLEAMKMELPIRATADGRVDRVSCQEGDLVQPGVPLIELDEAST